VEYLSFGPHVIAAAATTVGACAAAAAAAYPAWRRGDTAGAVRVGSRVLLGGSLIAVVTMTMTGTTSRSGSLNLVPIAGIVESFRSTDVVNGLENVIGNVAMFVPLGFFSVLGLRLPWFARPGCPLRCLWASRRFNSCWAIGGPTSTTSCSTLPAAWPAPSPRRHACPRTGPVTPGRSGEHATRNVEVELHPEQQVVDVDPLVGVVVARLGDLRGVAASGENP
jgi:hypothetical protein